MTPRIGSLCTGYGGLDIAVKSVFGGELGWWSDISDAAIKVMSHHHPDVDNIGDLTLVDWSTVPYVDILTAGYPCQPFSNAGKRRGIDDPRHIWPWIATCVGTVRPRIVVLENVAAHLRRGFDVVSAELASMGYRVAFGVVSAAEAGAPHLRKRLFIVAEDADSKFGGEWRFSASGQTEGGGSWSDVGGRSRTPIADTYRTGLEGSESARGCDVSSGGSETWGKYAGAIRRWERISGFSAPDPVVMGARGGWVLSPYFTEWMMGVTGRIMSVPGLTRKDQISLAGNGVVPQQAKLAIQHLMKILHDAG